MVKVAPGTEAQNFFLDHMNRSTNHVTLWNGKHEQHLSLPLE